MICKSYKMLSYVIYDFWFGIQDSWREHLFLLSHPVRIIHYLLSSLSLLYNQIFDSSVVRPFLQFGCTIGYNLIIFTNVAILIEIF